MAASPSRIRAAMPPDWDEAAQAMYRAAQAVSRPGGPGLFADLVRELAEILGAPSVFIAAFTDETRRQLRSLAAVLDGRELPGFDYPVAGSPCEKVVGRAFRHVASGVRADLLPGSLFDAEGMDAYSAYPLNDSVGAPLGLVVAMGRGPFADATLAEGLLKIFASRVAAEIERSRTDEDLRAAALAVSAAHGEGVLAELARYLATILHVELAFIATHEPEAELDMHMLAMHLDGHRVPESRYPLQSSPCALVLGQKFRAFASGLRELFPDDQDIQAMGLEAYAGFPMLDRQGRPLGTLGVASRKPLVQLERIEPMLQIFAVRAAAEIEQQRAHEALRRSEASYRAIFESAEDAMFIHDWDSGAVLDVNPKACETYGYSREELLSLSIGEISSGVPPYTAEEARKYIQLARLGRCPPFEWHRRNKDGSLRWDEVRLKPAQIDGRPHVLAFTRDITERKAADAMLRASEEQYRAIFSASADALILWDSEYRRVDVNPAYEKMFGWTREEVLGRGWDRPNDGPEYAGPRRELVRRALAGETCRAELPSRRKDGEIIQIEVHATPFVHRGEPHVLAIARDMSERRRAEERSRAREEQYRAIFDGSVDPMVLWSGTLHVVDVNAAFEQATGLRRDEVVGRHWSERPDAEDMRRLIPFIERALAGELTHTVESVTRADGSPFDIELRYLPVSLGGEPFALGIGRDVTARLEQERAVERSEARLRATVEAAFDCVIGMDSEGRIVGWNAAAERCFGHRHGDVIGRLLAEVILPHRHREAHARGLKHFRPGGRGPMVDRLVETTALRADGSEFPVELAISVAAVPEGSFFVGHLRDISARRAAEQELRDSEEQYRAIFNASADALVLRDPEFRIVDVNQTYERMSGYGRDEALGQARVLANPPEVAARLHGLHARALGGEPIVLQTQLLRRDGGCYELELRGVPIVHRGRPHVLYIGRDITEARRAEQALRDSEEQYRAVFNASADGMVLRDAEFRVVEVSPAYLAMTGYERHEVIGATRVLTQGDAENELCRRKHADVLGGEQLRLETTETRRDGSTYVAEVRGMPVSYQGEPHVLYVSRDITLRREAEAQRLELERQLRQAQKMEAIGQLTGGIAHDFNNILTSVLGYLVLGEERARRLADATLVRQLGQAQLAAQRARELIAQMLAFARRQRGERRPVALARLVRQSLQLLRPSLPATVALDTIELDALPDAALSPVHADAVQIEQVLFNLCINARDAMDGAGSLRVGLRETGSEGLRCTSCGHAIHAGRWVELCVADSGAGIAHDVLHRMFEPFFTTKEVGRGSGMGLAMVHGIVHEHGGHVVVDSAPGRGTVFQVLVPAADGEHVEVNSPLDAASTEAPRLRGSVLLVEDETMVGDFMVELLGGWGLDVALLRDPLAAREWLEDEANEVDLLITDQTMPQMTGLELARRCREVRPALPVLIYTGNPDTIDAQSLERCGVRALLRKPLDPDALRASLRTCLGLGAPAPG